METVLANNALSGAWLELTSRTDNRAEFGNGVVFASPRSPAERAFAKFEYRLILQLDAGHECITAAILNESVAKDKLPMPRAFLVDGTAERPMLAEDGGEPRKPSDVFDDLLGWFATTAKRTI